MQAFVDSNVQKGLIVQGGVQFDKPLIDMRPPPAASIALKAKPDFPHLRRPQGNCNSGPRIERRLTSTSAAVSKGRVVIRAARPVCLKANPQTII
jgi:hypothetical protein